MTIESLGSRATFVEERRPVLLLFLGYNVPEA